MRLRTLEHWKGTLSVVVAIASPFGAWAMDQSTLRGAVVLGVIGGLAATYNWVDQSIAKASQRRQAKADAAVKSSPEALL